jgi:predicted enzyme related to lactoylglutathione lyase
VPDTETIRDFYAAVAGLGVEPVSMGEYADYNLTGPDGPVAGVVHPLGKNEGVPPVWIVSFRVDDLDAAAARCVELGGEVVHRQERTIFGRDPAGAFAGFYQPGRDV